MAETMVFWDVCEGAPGAGRFAPGWGMTTSRQEALTLLKEMRRKGFLEAYLAKVTYERWSEPGTQ
jgi:hypothetical protein